MFKFECSDVERLCGFVEVAILRTLAREVSEFATSPLLVSFDRVQRPYFYSLKCGEPYHVYLLESETGLRHPLSPQITSWGVLAVSPYWIIVLGPRGRFPVLVDTAPHRHIFQSFAPIDF